MDAVGLTCSLKSEDLLSKPEPPQPWVVWPGARPSPCTGWRMGHGSEEEEGDGQHQPHSRTPGRETRGGMLRAQPRTSPWLLKSRCFPRKARGGQRAHTPGSLLCSPQPCAALQRHWARGPKLFLGVTSALEWICLLALLFWNHRCLLALPNTSLPFSIQNSHSWWAFVDGITQSPKKTKTKRGKI